MQTEIQLSISTAQEVCMAMLLGKDLILSVDLRTRPKLHVTTQNTPGAS